MSTTFINTSNTQISAELQVQIDYGTHIIRDQLERDGVPPEKWGTLVGVFLIGDTVDSSDYVLIKKSELRPFVKDLRKKATRELPIFESTITKCLEDVPAGVMRVLYISNESCGCMKLFYTESGKGSEQDWLQAKLRAAIGDASAYMDEHEFKIAEDIHAKIKHLPIKDALQVLSDAELATSDALAELRAKRAALGVSQGDMVRSFVEHLPDFRERWKSVLARVKKVVIPPDSTSANNMETTLMAAVYVFDKITTDIGLSKEEIAYLVGHFSKNEPSLQKLLARMDNSLRGQPFSGELQDFGVEWMNQGFPKLEVSHKLAATLALTDVPTDIEALAPWKAWSLIVPPGLFGAASVSDGDLARLWCVGTDIKFVLLTKGGLIGQINANNVAKLIDCSDGKEGPRLLWEAMSSLVKGVCLALSNPDDYKRQSVNERQGKAAKKQRDGEPDFAVSRFMLSAPVQIDLREHLLDTLSGKKHSGGGSPTVQFFVRGHWRNQAHGPRMSLRKQLRIEGYWKGNQDGAILLRNYKVKDESTTVT